GRARAALREQSVVVRAEHGGLLPCGASCAIPLNYQNAAHRATSAAQLRDRPACRTSWITAFSRSRAGRLEKRRRSWEEKMAKPRALIIGGSVGGLFAAHLLGSIGWDVDVFERVNEDLASRGAGIGTHPALREIMRRLGLSIDNSIVVVTPSYFCRD